jgi:sugar phosphate isomerase/epimerase
MKLGCAGAPHLTYCTNIHPGETWAEVREALARHVVAVRDRLLPDPQASTAPFGVGLRLSARAAAELGAAGAVEELKDLCARERLYVFTLNGFPYGPFHGAAVKERVYLPDWLDEERLTYTDRLAELLAALLPDGEGIEGSVSTVPGAFKPRARSAADAEAMARRLVRHVATLVDIRRRTGRKVSCALEPEPCCFLETTAEAIAFFEAHLVSPARLGELSARLGLTPAAAEEALREHLGVCFDACHMAVEFEDAAASLGALAAAGIRVPKIQISAGLRVNLQGHDAALAARLRAWAEGVYLHQVVERRGGAFTRYLDLPEALSALSAIERRSDAEPAEWRIHFHVPIFREIAGPIGTTQPELRALLAHLRQSPATQHLEVETYTWDVLPEEHRREGVVEAVARELAWAKEQLLQ